VRAASNFQVVRIMHTGSRCCLRAGDIWIAFDWGAKASGDVRREIVVLDSRAIETLLAIPL